LADAFRDAAARLRITLGDIAARIDHINSTPVDGLDSKDVIDVQISVADEDGLELVDMPTPTTLPATSSSSQQRNGHGRSAVMRETPTRRSLRDGHRADARSGRSCGAT
jgi:GrpB-like predicted nucleotidyltransferase (UPF0157 family)